MWETDLMDMTKLSHKNGDIKYLLTVIDTFSKYTWVQSLKSKCGSEILKAFSTILEENHHKPQKLRLDQGIKVQSLRMHLFSNTQKNKTSTFTQPKMSQKVLLLSAVIIH